MDSTAQHVTCVAYPGLKLLALVVDLSQACEMGLGLVFEEGIMQHLVVNVQLAYFGLHAIPLFLLQLFVLLLLLQCDYFQVAARPLLLGELFLTSPPCSYSILASQTCSTGGTMKHKSPEAQSLRYMLALHYKVCMGFT